ncbi:MAG: carbamate kinase [Acidimicrobiaceae bacterium]|nr:carbamate kinase [Acidimicrobiaceae bacterium]MDE0514809.1 carbamate kinase [Acidimicrobiaceae bacterium]MDE0655211.1 carbamate kinase [Acidimicrobiaceae bacterium]MXZ96482.1 carbamate kinase [Acidimicrobiaceae bacterium]MYF41839.1 carbamate kinase [Acidimicrobiaceae bacterium]
MAETAILALGGNALIREDQRGTLEEQYANALAMALSVRSLIRKGWNVVIVHGNGPQVGNLAIQHEGSTDLVPALPLFTLGAMTQGQLGSLICLALNEVCKREITGAVSVITHVEVDPGDPALSHPTKPIGPFFDQTEADALTSVRGWTMVEDSGRGYRRVVPSPRPMAPIEAPAISTLVDLGYIVVAGGGGGIPVSRSADGAYRGVDAVIDKDFAAERIADSVGAQALVMVTGVDAVRLNFGTSQERTVTEMTASVARRHLADGQFPPGSMGPKVEAAIEFVEATGRISAITTPELVYATLDEPGGVIEGPRGTLIVPDPVL